MAIIRKGRVANYDCLGGNLGCKYYYSDIRKGRVANYDCLGGNLVCKYCYSDNKEREGC